MYKDRFGKVRKVRIDTCDLEALNRVINSKNVPSGIKEYLKACVDEFIECIKRSKELYENDEGCLGYNFPVRIYLPFCMESMFQSKKIFL